MVVVVVVWAELHTLVSQQVRLERLGKIPRLLRLEAAPHRFADAQPRVRDVTDPTTTGNGKTLLLYKL